MLEGGGGGVSLLIRDDAEQNGVDRGMELSFGEGGMKFSKIFQLSIISLPLHKEIFQKIFQPHINSIAPQKSTGVSLIACDENSIFSVEKNILDNSINVSQNRKKAKYNYVYH